VAPGRRLYPEIEDDTEPILRQRHSEPQIAAAIDALDRLTAGPPQDEVPALLDALTPAFYADWSERQRTHAEAENGQVNQSAGQLFGTPDIDVAVLRDRLSEVEAPVLVITGSKDAATGILPGAAWAACFRKGEQLTIDSSGHYPWVDQPERFRHAVVGFLSRPIA
jgi:pimeloyl-ACP methyl ester carboxylesterase